MCAHFVECAHILFDHLDFFIYLSYIIVCKIAPFLLNERGTKNLAYAKKTEVKT